MAKKRQQKKKQMMSNLDDTHNQTAFCEDSDGSEFSDDMLEDDSDDLDDTLDLREDFEDDDSCLIDENSSRLIEY